MQFIVHSELMKNQKFASAMPADANFEVVQTSKGHAVFFGVDGQGKFYAVREASGEKDVALGWQLIDLTPPGGLKANSFAIFQNSSSMNYDVVVGITGQTSDTIYYAPNNTADSFSTLTSTGLNWHEYSPPSSVRIHDIHVTNMPIDGQSTQVVYVDVLQNPGDPDSLAQRYWVNPSSSQSSKWFERLLPGSYPAKNYQTCLGRPAGDDFAGSYTFGQLDGVAQLQYQDSTTYDGSSLMPDVVNLTPPSNARAIASAPSQTTSTDCFTNLFIAADNGLYLYPPDAQDGTKSCLQICSPGGPLADVFLKVRKMTARIQNGFTVIWCLNEQNELFYLSCPLGSENDVASWSIPMPICYGVENFAFFVKKTTTTQLSGKTVTPNIVFAHTKDSELTKLTQNPNTSVWEESKILLPTEDVTVMQENTTFTTQVKVLNSKGQMRHHEAMTIEPMSQMSAYINEVYYSLEPGVSVPIETDSDGSVNIIQNTTKLAAARFRLTVVSDKSTYLESPTDKAYGPINGVTGPDSLNVPLKDECGNPLKLVPTGTNSDDQKDVADALKNLAQARTDITSSDSTTSASTATGSKPTPNNLVEPVEDLSFGFSFSCLAGDLITWATNELKKAVHVATSTIKKAADGVWHFVVNIAGASYRAALNSVEAIGHAVVYVFNKIKTGIEELIAWLGFLLEWPDIVRTHNVIRHTMHQYLTYATNSFDVLENLIQEGINEVNTVLGEKQSLSKNTTTYTGSSDKINHIGAAHSPQAHWAAHHTKHHLSSASSDASPASIVIATIDKAIQDIKSLATTEAATALGTLKDIRQEIFDNITTMTALQIVEKISTLCTQFLVNAGGQFLKYMLKIAQDVADGIVKLLTTPLQIPIISPLYEKFVGHSLTFLDLLALIAAVPATIIYKAAHDNAPFGNDGDANYTTLMNMTLSDSGLPSSLKTQNPDASAAGIRPGPQDSTVAKEESVFSEAIDILQEISDYSAFFGTVVLLAVNEYKKNALGEVPDVAYWIGMAASFVYMSPNIPGAFNNPTLIWNILNDVITVCAYVKTLIDWNPTLAKSEPGEDWSNEGSPWVDCVLNLFWLVPAIGGTVYTIANGDETADGVLMFIANVYFDIGGVIAPLTSDEIVDPVIAVPAQFVQGGLNFEYGLLALASGWAMSKGW